MILLIIIIGFSSYSLANRYGKNKLAYVIFSSLFAFCMYSFVSYIIHLKVYSPKTTKILDILPSLITAISFHLIYNYLDKKAKRDFDILKNEIENIGQNTDLN